MFRVTAILILAVSVCKPQTQPTRKESISVSAGFTKEQLKLADQFDARFLAARQALRSNPRAVVVELTALLDTIAANTFLDHNKPQVLNWLGQAYIVAGQPKEAIKIFEQRLSMEADDCKPQASYPSGCAEVQMDLATAKSAAGDVHGAVDLMRQAVDNFLRQLKLEKPKEVDELQHFVNLWKLGKGAFIYAALLVRAGNGTEAKPALQQSITALTEIVSNTEVQASLRADAQQLLDLAKKQAQTLR
jgi:tetratricopeptide (TPR) repeat protein